MPKRHRGKVNQREAKKPARYRDDDDESLQSNRNDAAEGTSSGLNSSVLKTIMDKLQALEAKVSTKSSGREGGSSDSDSVVSEVEELGDLGDDSGEDDWADYKRPVTSFGTMIGSTVPQRIRKKIINNKFIEIAELLPNLGQVADEYTMQPGRDGTKLVKARPKQDITFSQWCEGFDVFLSIYVESAAATAAAIRLTKDLLTYKKEVIQLHKSGHDWAGFDRHFRMEMETNPAPWSTFRPDLHLQYANNSSHTLTKSTFRPLNNNHKQQPQNSRTIRTPDGNTLPLGFCVAFHSKNLICDKGPQCTYMHKCPRCPSRHPVYRPCYTTNNPNRPTPNTMPANANSRK